MGYYNYLCELLRPLRVYRLDEGSLSGAELYAAGEGLDTAAEALEKAAREGVLMTAEDEGLSRRERLFSRVGARTTPALRRLAIASLLRVGGDGFTLEAVNQTISGCGVRAVAAETDEQGVVRDLPAGSGRAGGLCAHPRHHSGDHAVPSAGGLLLPVPDMGGVRGRRVDMAGHRGRGAHLGEL